MTLSTAVRETLRAGFPAFEAGPSSPTGRPPVLLLHGAFADHHTFRGWLEPLSTAGHLAVAPARRGRVGVGPDRAAGLRFSDYLADTLAVLDTLPEPPVVVGHSLGGLLAQKVAELGRARAVVLVASAPPAMLTAQPVALPRFLPLMPRIMAGRPIAIPAGACSVLALNRLPEEDRPPVHARLTPESGRVYRSLLLGTVRVAAERVTVPVRVLGGTEDRIVSPALTRRTARHYGVQPRLYDGRGHWLLAEPGWRSLVADVLGWVESVSSEPSS